MAKDPYLVISKIPDIEANRIRAELAAKKASALSNFVREANGEYETRPSTKSVLNAIWFGQTDATQHPDFVEYDPATGVGDIWIEVEL